MKTSIKMEQGLREVSLLYGLLEIAQINSKKIIHSRYNDKVAYHKQLERDLYAFFCRLEDKKKKRSDFVSSEYLKKIEEVKGKLLSNYFLKEPLNDNVMAVKMCRFCLVINSYFIDKEMLKWKIRSKRNIFLQFLAYLRIKKNYNICNENIERMKRRVIVYLLYPLGYDDADIICLNNLLQMDIE